MDITALIASFSTASGTYAVTRQTSGGYTRGVANPTVNSTIQITASLQPATGQDLLRLPEGRRTNETRVIFTDTLLRTGDQGQTVEADLVLIEGDLWEVQHVETWIDSTTKTTGYRCIVQQPTPAVI